MHRKIASLAALPVAVLLSGAIWAQVAVRSEPPEGAAPVPPSGAASLRTPGTPGASDTPGALMRSPSNPAPTVSSSPESHSGPKSKKHTNPDDPTK